MIDMEKFPWVNCQSSRLGFWSGVTCSFRFGASSHAPFAFEVDVNFIIDLVCAYNPAINFVFNGRVE